MKPSDLAQKKKAEQGVQAWQDALYRRAMHQAINFCSDAALIAANHVFHRRGDIVEQFRIEFVHLCNEIASGTLDDAADDKTMVYSKSKLDDALRYVMTDKYFKTWEERHGTNET